MRNTAGWIDKPRPGDFDTAARDGCLRDFGIWRIWSIGRPLEQLVVDFGDQLEELSPTLLRLLWHTLCPSHTPKPTLQR